jgi:RNA polymerase sigma-70 factor (ECF subfamily)
MANTLKPPEPNSDYTVVTPDAVKEESGLPALIEGCIAGDRRCQAALLKRYRGAVHGMVYKMLGPSHDIDDVMQQVFIRFFQSLDRFKGLSTLDTWLYRIAAKVCMDQLRKKYRKRQLTVVGNSHETAQRAEAPWQTSPVARLERRELIEHIYRALDKLSAEKRSVLVMFEMEERSMEEIADILHKPLGTIKSRLFHARREMERHLGRYLDR